jgi:uncharacterized membrane protein YidH (DUF202 family)
VKLPQGRSSYIGEFSAIMDQIKLSMRSLDEISERANPKLMQSIQTLIIGRLMVIFILMVTIWIWNSGRLQLSWERFPQGLFLIFLISVGLTIVYFFPTSAQFELSFSDLGAICTGFVARDLAGLEIRRFFFSVHYVVHRSRKRWLVFSSSASNLTLVRFLLASIDTDLVSSDLWTNRIYRC